MGNTVTEEMVVEMMDPVALNELDDEEKREFRKLRDSYQRWLLGTDAGMWIIFKDERVLDELVRHGRTFYEGRKASGATDKASCLAAKTVGLTISSVSLLIAHEYLAKHFWDIRKACKDTENVPWLAISADL